MNLLFAGIWLRMPNEAKVSACEVVLGTELQHFITSDSFLAKTDISPYLLEIRLNGKVAENDMMLLPGDELLVGTPTVPIQLVCNDVISVSVAMNAENSRRFSVCAGISLAGLVFSKAFLGVTTMPPDGLLFSVNGVNSALDSVLADGDQVRVAAKGMVKGVISSADLIRKLHKIVGLKYLRQRGSHSIWVTGEGRRVVIPRHSRDLTKGMIDRILDDAGLAMGVAEFTAYSPRHSRRMD